VSWVRDALVWPRILASTAGWGTASVLGRVGGQRVSQLATRQWSESVLRGLGIDLVAEGVDKIAGAQLRRDRGV